MEQNMRGHPLQQSEIDRVVELLRAGMSGPEAAKKTGMKTPTVYRIAERNKIRMDPHALSVDDRTRVVDAARSGTSRNELARLFGVSTSTIADAVHSAGVDFATKRTDWGQKAAQTVARKNPGFEYVDGYENHLSTIRVKCLECGEVFKISYSHAYHGKLACPNCTERQNKHACIVCGKITAHAKYCSKACEKKAYTTKQRERRKTDPEYIKRIAEKQAERERKKKQAEELRKARIEQRRHVCPVCGEITLRPKYCSERCTNRAENKRRETIRRTKIKNAIVDKDITLEGVWQNSLGICYLCGCVCDWDDKQEKDGTIICGDRYPSIDHIIPLSAGGKHSWGNVALACRKCNTEKRDKVPPPVWALRGGKQTAGEGPLFPLRPKLRKKELFWRREP